MHLPIDSTRRQARLATLTLVVAAVAGCASAPPLATPPAPSVAPSAAPSATPLPPASTATSAAAAASSSSEPVDPPGFSQWLTTFRATARAAGIDEATLNAALAGTHYLHRVVELDRSQPESTRTVWAYLDTAVSPQRVTTGQEKLLQFRQEADAAAARYGVPATILAAIWGMESNYGSNYGSISTLDALATLAFEGRREDWARSQLLAALKILQNGDISQSRMIGSWAGAMGQTQFLPSSFLAYAVDADADGRRDIWGSMPDVFASTANFLARSGWQAGLAWGAEVRLPAGFDVSRADDSVRQPSTQWAAEGVQSADGGPLPTWADAAVFLPAGASGPAFLVGPNFRAILRYNNSTSYALAVVLLAQRLGDGPAVQAAWPRELTALTRSQLLELQTALNERGFDSGKPDGSMGPATRGALRRYQRSVGLPADGYPTVALLQGLQGLQAKDAGTASGAQTPP